MSLFFSLPSILLLFSHYAYPCVTNVPCSVFAANAFFTLPREFFSFQSLPSLPATLSFCSDLPTLRPCTVSVSCYPICSRVSGFILIGPPSPCSLDCPPLLSLFSSPPSRIPLCETIILMNDCYWWQAFLFSQFCHSPPPFFFSDPVCPEPSPVWLIPPFSVFAFRIILSSFQITFPLFVSFFSLRVFGLIGLSNSFMKSLVHLLISFIPASLLQLFL